MMAKRTLTESNNRFELKRQNIKDVSPCTRAQLNKIKEKIEELKKWSSEKKFTKIEETK